MGVQLEVDPRNDPGGDRHALAADRISIGRDGRFQFGNSAETERHHILEELGRRDLDQREIAIVRDEQNRGRILIGIALALDRKIAAVADDMGVGHDARSVDDEAGANPFLNRAGIPRRLVIRLDVGRGDANEAFLDLAVWLRAETCREEKRGKNQKAAAKHRREVREDETNNREIKFPRVRGGHAGLSPLRRLRGRGRARRANVWSNRR